MKFYCTNCWNETEAEHQKCPQCGAIQQELKNEDYVKKLIRALNHPEPETAARAAYILGESEAMEAVPHLYKIMTNSKDAYIVAAAIKAIGKIQPLYLKSVIDRYTDDNYSLIIRNAAKDVIKNINIKN